MNIEDVIKNVRGNIKESQLIPVNEVKTQKNEIEEKYNIRIPSYNEIFNMSKKINKNIDLFYICTQPLVGPICFFDGFVFIEIASIETDYLKSFYIKERINTQTSQINNYIQNNEYKEIFRFIDSKIKGLAFVKHFYNIPDEMKFEIFVELYSSLDYPMEIFNNKFIVEILKYNKTSTKKNIDKFITDETITIYRGECPDSTNYKKAFSWTTNLCTALFFASRFGNNGIVYTTEIKPEDIDIFIENRNENEVFINPNKIKNVTNLNFFDYKQLLSEPIIISDYILHKNDINSDYFINPTSIHGVLHSKRVLLLSAIISFLKELDSTDKIILFTASKFHDIGRTNDNYCIEHGKLSFKKIKELKLLDTLPYWNKENNEILKYIIENHCIDDKIGLNNIENYNIDDKNHAIYLYKIFKDIDGLDRVRINDLSLKYLRFEESKKLCLIAYYLYKYIE